MIDGTRDRVKTARRYRTADELLELMRRSTIEVQRMWRGHLARGRAAAMRLQNELHELELRETR